jgi:hypothetical protein
MDKKVSSSSDNFISSGYREIMAKKEDKVKPGASVMGWDKREKTFFPTGLSLFKITPSFVRQRLTILIPSFPR